MSYGYFRIPTNPSLRAVMLSGLAFMGYLVWLVVQQQRLDTWRDQRDRALDFLHAAERGDSAALARFSAGPAPLEWAAAARHNAPKLLHDAAASAAVREGWRYDGDTTAVAFTVSTTEGPCYLRRRKGNPASDGPRPLRMTFAGSGQSTRVVDVKFEDCASLY